MLYCVFCHALYEDLDQEDELEILFEFGDRSMYISFYWSRLGYGLAVSPESCDECRSRILKKFAEEILTC
jgi:hypothetical protein